ncbi:unnamed protein product [Durusdinium trenchii]|uniref:Right handed beta helix domain-containing protein n=1 Tax=Durusdinium trenchii TaxID=1381693 RepID=A0ABP0LKG0_9DINO
MFMRQGRVYFNLLCSPGIRQRSGGRSIPNSMTKAALGALWTWACRTTGYLRIQLDGPITGNNLTLHGNMEFYATRPFHKACLQLTGTLSVVGTVLIQNCSNVNSQESGGGGQARGLQIPPTGNLTFRNCVAKSSGGGFACGDHGVHLTGSLAFHHCEAELQGGGLIVRSGALTQKHGSLKFSHCFCRPRSEKSRPK